jgi:N-acyl-D-amino-acid deacylase
MPAVRAILKGSPMMRLTRFAIAALVFVTQAIVLDQPAFAAEPEWDFLITDARIIDGSGNPWFRGSVAVQHNRIVWMGTSGSPIHARRIISGKGRVLAPGFIDLMGQDTFVYLESRDAAASKLTQGITTHFSGEGWSYAPRIAGDNTIPEDPAGRLAILNGHPVNWTDLAGYLDLLEKHGVPLNVIHNVGATQVRRAVIGDVDRAATPAELEKMRGMVDEAMRQGAAGLSTALIYPPAAFASTGELVELAKVVARYGGFYSTHMRDESGGLLKAIDEATFIGRSAGVPVHIYHLKAAGVENWPLMSDAIKKIDDARASGVDVTADIYPYVRNGLALEAFVPSSALAEGNQAFYRNIQKPEVRARLRTSIETDSTWENWYLHVGRDWNNVLITGSTTDKDLVGLSVAAAARKRGKADWDFVFDAMPLHLEVAPLSMNEEQKRLGMRAPWMMFDTDAGPTSPRLSAFSHPRAYGTFPRILAKYVRDDHVLTLEEAIRRMTSAPANLLGLYDRGRIATGMVADLVLFDPTKIQDNATFAQPTRYSTGIDYVWVNGRLAVDDGKVTGVLAGEVIRLPHKAKTL